MIEQYKAKMGQQCPGCGGTETSEICSPVEIGIHRVDDIGFLIECHDCDDIYTTYPF